MQGRAHLLLRSRRRALCSDWCTTAQRREDTAGGLRVRCAVRRAVLFVERRHDVRVLGRQLVPNRSFHVNVDMVAMAPVLRSAALAFLDARAKCTEWIRRVRVLAGVESRTEY